jgi:RimJ/RimL family protein N-acetyltransferase
MILAFKTQRLTVCEVEKGNVAYSEYEKLLDGITRLLTFSVVLHLPSSFHHIDSREKAHIWLEQILSESRLFSVELADDNGLIGFLFVSVVDEGNDVAHLGYLLAEQYWGQGLASELLHEFIQYSRAAEAWQVLIAGVPKENTASVRLLQRLGFTRQAIDDGVGYDARDTIFYRLALF